MHPTILYYTEVSWSCHVQIYENEKKKELKPKKIFYIIFATSAAFPWKMKIQRLAYYQYALSLSLMTKMIMISQAKSGYYFYHTWCCWWWWWVRRKWFQVASLITVASQTSSSGGGSRREKSRSTQLTEATHFLLLCLLTLSFTSFTFYLSGRNWKRTFCIRRQELE